VQAGVEECDDGNKVDTDACTAMCKTAKCGDTVVQAGVEECDDGNMVQTDMCLNTCKTAKCGDGQVQANVEQCDDGNMVDNDACTNACKSNAQALRPNVLLCGSSTYDIKKFFPGGVNQFVVMNSCNPDNNTQAIIVTRSFANAINAANFKTYLGAGGIALTEHNVSDEVYGLAFAAVAQGPVFTGSCTDRAPTVTQFTPADPIWVGVPYQAITLGESGCGYSISAFPGITKLAGWNANDVSIGYRDLMLGRVWLTDFDWQDGMANVDMTYTNKLMGYMITHRK
jgi:cysteine-rich repeat protein